MTTKFLLTLTAISITAATTNAHFIWLSPVKSGDQTRVCVCFGEDASDDSVDYLSRVSSVKVSKVRGTASGVPLQLNRTPEEISTSIDTMDHSVYVASHDLGVMDRGDSNTGT